MRVKMEVPHVTYRRRIRGIQEGGFHLVGVFLTPFAAEHKAQGRKELLLIKGPNGLIHLMKEGGGTSLAADSALVAGGALFLDFALEIFVLLDFLGAPLHPTPVGVIVIDVLRIHECLKLGSNQNTVG